METKTLSRLMKDACAAVGLVAALHGCTGTRMYVKYQNGVFQKCYEGFSYPADDTCAGVIGSYPEINGTQDYSPNPIKSFWLYEIEREPIERKSYDEKLREEKAKEKKAKENDIKEKEKMRWHNDRLHKNECYKKN